MDAQTDYRGSGGGGGGFATLSSPYPLSDLKIFSTTSKGKSGHLISIKSYRIICLSCVRIYLFLYPQVVEIFLYPQVVVDLFTIWNDQLKIGYFVDDPVCLFLFPFFHSKLAKPPRFPDVV